MHMQRRAHRPSIMAPAVALVGAAFIGGCALIYKFDYSSESASSGVGGSSSSGGPTSSSSGSNSSTNSSSGQGGGAASTSSSTAGGGGGGVLPVVIWQQQFGGAGADMAGHPGVDISSSGDVFITGVFQTPTDLGAGPLPCSTPQCSFLAKLDPATGTPVWSTSLAGNGGFVPSLAATPNDGGVVVAGSYVSVFTPAGMPSVPSLGSANDMFLAKFNDAGVCVWSFAYGDTNEQRANTVAVDDNGMIYLAGMFSGMFPLGACMVTELNGPNAFIAQFDNTGKCNWVRKFDTPSQGFSLAPIESGITFAGTFAGMTTLAPGISLNSINGGSFLAAFDSAGKPVSAKAFPGKDIALAYDQTTAGAAFGIASVNGPGSVMGTGDISKDGLTVSSPVLIPGSEQGNLESITCTPTGRRVLTGYSLGDLTLGTPIKNHGAQDIFVAYVDKSGSVLNGVGYGDAMAQSGRSIRSDSGGKIYLFGDFQGTVDFGAGPLSSAGSSDMFLVKFSDVSFP